MLFDHSSNRLYFHDKLLLNEQIGVEVAEQRPVFVKDLQRMLLLHQEPLFPETVNESVLINLFQMSVPMITVNSKSRFANHIAKLHDVFHKVTSFISLCAFCAFSWLIPVIRPVFLCIATKTHKRHKIKNGLANHIAKLPDEIHKPSAFISFCAFCAFSWLVHIPGYFFRFVFVAVFLAAGFFVFFSGLLAAFLTFAFTVFPAGFFATFFATFFFATFFGAFFFTAIFTAFFAAVFAVFFAGLGAFRATGFFAGFAITAVSSVGGGISAASISRQPWASRTAIIADKMSFQVCCCIITAFGNMQPSQQT